MHYSLFVLANLREEHLGRSACLLGRLVAVIYLGNYFDDRGICVEMVCLNPHGGGVNYKKVGIGLKFARGPASTKPYVLIEILHSVAIGPVVAVHLIADIGRIQT